jgi:hypothetical protein
VVVKAGNGSGGELPIVNTPFLGKLDADLMALKADLAQALQRAAVAEALADEREKRIEDLRRMLPPPDAKPRRWWLW